MIKMKVYENWREYYSDPDAQRINQRYSENCWYMDGKPPFRDPESLFESMTVKYPEHGEILEDAATRGHADGELFILYVDLPGVVEKLRSAEDLDNTEWAVRVYQDSIELYDKYDGLKLFAVVVREALASGNCEIS